MTTSSEPPLMPLLAVYMRRCAQRKENEFFEPQLMSSPPPMAEQFLYDLRKMITCARERIRTRRHIPKLPPVVESEDEGSGTGGVVGKLSKSEFETEKEVITKILSNKDEKPKMDEMKKEVEKRADEMALSMEEIVREQQQRRGNKEEEIHRWDHVKKEEKDPSPRSSMDSGRGSDKREEDEIDDQPKEEKEMEVVRQEFKNEDHELEDNLEAEEKKGAEKKIMEEIGNEEVKIIDNAALKNLEPTGNQILSGINAASIQQQQQQPISRIPVGTASTSKSPRLQLKFTAFCRRAPPLPPRPPPPPPAAAAADGKTESAIEGKLKGQNPVAAIKRRITTNSERSQQQPSSLPIGNSYAICPPPSFACSDRMKKSLPRRKKAIVPMSSNSATILPKATPTAV